MREIVADLQESGIAAPSTHDARTASSRSARRSSITAPTETDIDALVSAVLEFGARRTGDLIEVEAPPLAAQ